MEIAVGVSTSSAWGSGHIPKPVPILIPSTEEEAVLSTHLLSGLLLLYLRLSKPRLTWVIKKPKGFLSILLPCT